MKCRTSYFLLELYNVTVTICFVSHCGRCVRSFLLSSIGHIETQLKWYVVEEWKDVVAGDWQDAVAEHDSRLSAANDSMTSTLLVEAALPVDILRHLLQQCIQRKEVCVFL